MCSSIACSSTDGRNRAPALAPRGSSIADDDSPLMGDNGLSPGLDPTHRFVPSN